MIIEIITKEEVEFGLLVTFSSPIGSGKGIWVGTSPALEVPYDVEFEIKDDLIWGKTIFKTEHTYHRLSLEGDTILIEGQLNHVYSDGVIIIKIDKSLVMATTIGEPSDINDHVQIKCSFPNLYNTNY